MLLASRFVQCRLPQVGPRLQIRHLSTSKPVPPRDSQNTGKDTSPQESPQDGTKSSKNSPNYTQAIDSASNFVSETSSKVVDTGAHFAAQAKQSLGNTIHGVEKKVLWAWFKRSLLLKCALGLVTLVGIGSYSVVPLLYAKHVEKKREESINSAFENGSAPLPTQTSVVRRKELDDIKRILTPDKSANVYHLITGENGTGKTTLVLEACREVGAGCIYVDVPEKVSAFGLALGAAINFEFNESISLGAALQHQIFGTKLEATPIIVPGVPEPETSIERVKPVLLRAAAKFKQATGRPPVLVIDNVNRLATKAPAILEELQEFARDRAVRSELIVVFVSSEGTAPNFLQSRGSISRASAPYEVRDISNDEAVKYLIARGVTEELAKKAAQELTGGRFTLLNKVVASVQAKKTYEVIKNEIFADVEKQVTKAGLNDDSPQCDSGLKVVSKLLRSKSKSMNKDDFIAIVKNASWREALLQPNVFSYHPSQNIITFQSQAVATYANEKLAGGWWLVVNVNRCKQM